MQSGIYYLVARNIDTNEKIYIELTDKEENRYCTTLSHIDKLTTKFINKQHLIKRLYDNGYITFINADIYIEYKHNELKFQEVMYKDLEDFAKVSIDSESKLDRDDQKNKQAINTYVNKLRNDKFREYALNSSRLNDQIKKYIKEWYSSQNEKDANFNLGKIYDELYKYKVFRDFKYVIDEYNNPEYKKYIDEINNFRSTAKKIDFKPVKEEKLNEVLEQVIKEHNEEKEEFLTEDDWNNNYYPYNKKK